MIFGSFQMFCIIGLSGPLAALRFPAGTTNETRLKARSHDPFLRIRFLLVPKIRSCEHNENDLPTHGSLSLKKQMEIEHALFSSDTLPER